MTIRASLGWVFLGVLTVAASGACNNDPAPASCTNIPAGGCPLDNGASVCSDPTCSAAYACDDGKWILTQTCPPHPMDAGGSDADALDALDAPAPVDAPFDVPPGASGGPGCTDLELPDCSVATGIACAGSTGCCGCMDLYVCVSGGWTLWGSCVDGGIAKN